MSRNASATSMARRLAQILAFNALWGGLFFFTAGRLAYLRAWVFLGTGLLLLGVNAVVVVGRNPAVIDARSRIRRGTKGFDKVFALLYGALALATPVVAGLDLAGHGGASLPLTTLWPGLVLLVLGDLPILAALATNPHLEQTVRIQNERGHQVVSAGPYRLVRHPMYVGMILQQAAVPLVIGSSWALAPALAAIPLVVLRTSLEDRALRRELPGYEEYAARTRFRLIPGLW